MKVSNFQGSIIIAGEQQTSFYTLHLSSCNLAHTLVWSCEFQRMGMYALILLDLPNTESGGLLHDAENYDDNYGDYSRDWI